MKMCDLASQRRQVLEKYNTRRVIQAYFYFGSVLRKCTENYFSHPFSRRVVEETFFFEQISIRYVVLCRSSHFMLASKF